MELRNIMWERELSQLTVNLPLIQQLHHYQVMLRIMLTHLFILHTLPTSLHMIFTQIWLWFLRVLICIIFFDLYLCTEVFHWMMLSCAHPFWTLHLLWMRNNRLTGSVLHNQHAMSFKKSLNGSTNINTWWRRTPFCFSPLRSFLTSLVNLPSIILHVYLYPQMHPLLITQRTHRMLVHHLIMERINYSLKIHLILHLSFPKTQRMSLFTFHLPLYVIHPTMRMSTNILDFMILVIVISSPHHMVMMLIHSFLIYLIHWSTKIHLSTKSKPHRPSRHLSLSWWLCQALIVLRLVSLPIWKLFKHSRLLITHLYALKINPTLMFYFLHSNYTIHLLIH